MLSWEQTDQPGSSAVEDIEEVTNYVAAVNYAFGRFIRTKASPSRSDCSIIALATATVRKLYRQVSDDRQKLLATPGTTVSAMQLFERLPEHPFITMPLVTRLLSITKPTAGKAIDLLLAAGILAAVGDRRRDRLCTYENYVRLLDQ